MPPIEIRLVGRRQERDRGWRDGEASLLEQLAGGASFKRLADFEVPAREAVGRCEE
jgi:hypothetical protein